MNATVFFLLCQYGIVIAIVGKRTASGWASGGYVVFGFGGAVIIESMMYDHDMLRLFSAAGWNPVRLKAGR